MYTIVDIDVEENAGLKTEEALQVLHDEIKSVLDEYESKFRDRSVFHSSADHQWTSIFISDPFDMQSRRFPVAGALGKREDGFETHSIFRVPTPHFVGLQLWP
jgi:hypothetical protein